MMVRINTSYHNQTIHEDSEKNKHQDFEANKKRAEVFAEEKDIFRRPSVCEKYDRMNWTVSKIQASSHCMFFTKVPSTNSGRTPLSIPVSYNCSMNEFETKIQNAYNKLNKMMEY